MSPMEPYRPREIRLLERWQPGGWRIKVYGISARGGPPDSRLVRAAKELAGRELAGPAATTEHYGLGFLGVHEGRGASVAFLHWWARENELHHRLWIEDSDVGGLRPREPGELFACVWDLEVVTFERDAWIRCVLGRPRAPGWDEYLARALTRRGGG